MKPDFDAALQCHFSSIKNRDIEGFKSHLSRGDTLCTILQTGRAFTSPQQTIIFNEQWFKDPHWTWEASLVCKVVGADLAMALIKYEYRARSRDALFSSWLIYVFHLEDVEWRIVHDQNTALDYTDFTRVAAIKIE